MKSVTALALLAFLLCLPSVSKGADKIEMRKSLASEVCGQVHTILLHRKPKELAYDPAVEEDMYPRDRSSLPAPLVKIQTGTLYPVEWGNLWNWGEFNKEWPEKFDELQKDGQVFNTDYEIRSAKVPVYGEATPVTLFQMTWKGTDKSARLPVIFTKPAPDDAGLSEKLNNLEMTDMVRHGAFGYPVVRKPGSLLVYKISADNPGSKLSEKYVSLDLVCEFRLRVTSAPQ